MINNPSLYASREMAVHLAKIAEENGAVNLANDFSDFPCKPELLNTLVWHLTEGRNKYAPGEGVLELRQVISTYYNLRYGYTYNPDSEVTITAGAIQAIYTSISALVREGDEVIVFEPAFETYVPAIEARGAKTIYYPLLQPDFRVDWSAFTKLINSKTKLIIINTPHNPTGTIFTNEDFEQLQKIVNGTKIFVLSDEAFGELIYNGFPKTSICQFPRLSERAIIVGSLGKTLCVPGWKIGFCLAPANLMERFRVVHRYQVYSVNHPIQLALADYLKGKDSWFQYSIDFQNRRDLFNSLITTTAFSIIPAQGGYFQVIGFENISRETDIDFSLRLAKDYGVLALPMTFFYHDAVDYRQLRICFGKSEEEIRLAISRLEQVK
jgi:methionine aminotransferase